LVLIAAGIAAAQPALPAVPGAGSAAQKKVDYKLELKPSSKIKVGKVALAGGVAGAEPHRMFLENLEILAPIAVTVLTKDPSHDIKVQLGKYDWDKNFSREGSTKGKTSLTFKVRTAGDLKILISSPDPEPRPFQLVVWVGDVAKPVLAPVAVKKSSWKAPANMAAKGPAASPTGSGSTGIVIAIVIAGVLVAAALLLRGRRKQ
jgi:hypothetical protein